MNDIAIMKKVFENVGRPPGAEAYCKAAVLEAVRLTRADCAGALAKPPQTWRDLERLPVRECASLHVCCLCRFDIRMGDQYHDGGLKRRAHVRCVLDEKRRATC